ncbi:uncharacterized protein LOC134787715 isoform X2 [Penaeus indicus]|uniref:uncharacterized protein LOC134787715 isoform X2 n=1 Tax=Penaeus indicus TaxID=29960 RepID=UPI00300D822D
MGRPRLHYSAWPLFSSRLDMNDKLFSSNICICLTLAIIFARAVFMPKESVKFEVSEKVRSGRNAERIGGSKSSSDHPMARGCPSFSHVICWVYFQLCSVFPALWKSAEAFSNFPFASLNPEFSLNISDDPKEGHSNLIERAEIAQLVRSRMQSLGLPPEDYDDVSEKRNSLSFVIINPSCDLKLEEGDIVYLIRPSPFSAQKTFERHNSRRKSNISLCDTRRRSTTFSRPPPLTSAPKSNSLSLPDSPQISPGFVRGRSNSLRVDDILMRRSNSLRFGLEATRKINSFEELGISPITPLTRDERTGSIKIPVNGSIGLEVTPPEECGSEASVPSIQLQGTIV